MKERGKETTVAERVKALAWVGIDTIRAIPADDGGPGILGGLVQPGRSAKILTRVYRPFKGDRLVVSQDSAKTFQITHVYAGCDRAIPSPSHGPILLDPFAVDLDALASVGKAAFDGTTLSLQLNLPDGLRKLESAAGVLGGPFPMPVAHAGMDIAITIENIGKAPARLRGAFLGMNLL